MPSFPWSSRPKKSDAAAAAATQNTESVRTLPRSTLSHTSATNQHEDKEAQLGATTAMAEGAGTVPEHVAVPSSSAASAATAVGQPEGEPKSDAAPAGPPGGHQPLQLGKVRFWLVFLAMMLSIFLFALDQLIVSS